MDIVSRLIATRARIEAAVSGPCVLVVTSALPTDGSSILASALFESLILAGHSVLLISDDKPSGARGLSRTQRALKGNGEPPTLALPTGKRDSHSLTSARAAFETYRDLYEYTIVDGSVALASGSALAFARSADFVLVAFEAGRGARDADRDLARTLHATGTSLLGVVTLERETIRSFDKERRVSTPAARTSVPLDEAPKRGAALSSTIV